MARSPSDEQIGWIGVGPARDADAPVPVEVYSFYVADGWQGQGIGRLLMDTYAPTECYLWVTEGNDAARASYERLGFVADGGRSTYNHPHTGERLNFEDRMVRRATL